MAKTAGSALKNLDELLQSAINLHRDGQFQMAKANYLKILTINPLQVDALHLLGVIELQASNWERAAEYISKSLTLNPNQPGALNNYGIVLKELKKYTLANEQYLKAIKLQPYDANAYMNLGNSYQAQGDLVEAIKAYDKSIVLEPTLTSAIINRALALSSQGAHVAAVLNYKLALLVDPRNPNIYNNLANSLKEIEEFQMALSCYTTAIDLNPRYADAYFNKGNLLRDIGRIEEALTFYNKAIEFNSTVVDHYINQGNLLIDLDQSQGALESFNIAIKMRPGFAQAYNNRGNAYLDLGLTAQALQDYSYALSLDPKYVQAYSNRGNALRLLGDLAAAKTNYLRALCLDPCFAVVHNNLGVLLMESFLTRPSIECFNAAIELNPTFADAYFNKANSLREIKFFSDAVTQYSNTLAIKPSYDFLKGLLLHSKMQVCDWSNLDHYISELITDIESHKKCSPPFPVLGLLDSPEHQLRVATLWTQVKFPQLQGSYSAVGVHSTKSSSKIRLGYFSADFRDHPVSYLMADLFEHHDRSRFEIIAFSLGPYSRDFMRERLENSFDHWIECSSQSDDQIAVQARSMEIDIAIDLGGFTRNSRTGIFAKRAAPVQVSYIGYLGTMGAPYIDYLLADKVVIPPELQRFYTESIAYLPIYQANDSKRQMANKAMTRKSLGLPEDAFIYCCFNTNYKITPEIFTTWMSILKQVKQGVLLIYADTETVKINLIREAQLQGVDVSRIYFGERLAQSEYLLRYTLSDLFLDTSPYNAGTTASDALWCGLPVLTMMGKSFASRIASSLLTALGMTELITHSLKEYENLAVELGHYPQKIFAIREKLRAQKNEAALFNTKKFTTELERVFLEMVRRVREGEPLNNIEF